MTVMEMKRPELHVRSRAQAELHVERTDITFQDMGRDRVRIQVIVHNVGAHRSPPTPMTLQSAPLGAFVPWRPLVRLMVPALEPGESRELSTEVARPHPAPLGSFDRVPPRRLLTAVNSPDEPPPQRGTSLGALLNLSLRMQTARSSGRDSSKGPSLAPDLWDLVGRRQPYWAGNINVFIGDLSVERHQAKALRVYPGRINQAMFIVGDRGKRDAYAFELAGLTPDWPAALWANDGKRMIDSSNEPIQERRWVESEGGLIVILATHPPAGCHTGKVDVHVMQRSSRKEAIVEFDLDAAAQGAGCYFV